MSKIGFITSSSDKLNYYFPTKAEPLLVPSEPPFTPDDQIAVDYLRQIYKLDIKPVVWGTPVNELKSFDMLIVRSPWDYMDSAQTRCGFLRWIDDVDKAGIKVLNKPVFIKWMLDKHYLKDFEQSGIPIVPTEYTKPGEFVDLEEIYRQKGPFVIKPCISAAGYGLRFIQTIEDAKLHQESINQKTQYQEFMIQDFVEEIRTNGEWSLIYFAEEYSHAVLKKPASGSILIHAELGGTLSFENPDAKLICFGNMVVKSIKKAFEIGTNSTYQNDALYIRIDVIESLKGFYLSECEGVEPELFFRARTGSETNFAKNLVKYLK